MKTKIPVSELLSKFPLSAVAIVAAILLYCPGQLRATTALDFTGGSSLVTGVPTETLGWSFTISGAILLTDLGVWDGQQTSSGGPGLSGSVGDGLVDPHKVTIWTSTGVFVTSAVIPSGTGATLQDEFRYVSIAPTLLVPGSYVIGALYPGSLIVDSFAANAATITTASGVSYNGSRSIPGDAFPPGDFHVIPNSYFGPNFQFTTELPSNGNGVPEGGTSAVLLGVGLFAVIMSRRPLTSEKLRDRRRS